MKENGNTGDEARTAILAARGGGLMADALARRARGVGWEPAVYVDGEGAAGGLEGFFRTGGEVLLVALERGMKLGGDGEEALFLAMRAGLRIIPVGGEDAAAVWRAVVPPDMPELGGVEVRRLEDGWEGLLAGNGKKDARERKSGMDIWSGGPDGENPEVVLCEDDVLEEIRPVEAASPGRTEAGYALAPGEGWVTRECRSKGIPLWVVSAGVCAAALTVAFFIPGIRGKSPAPEVNSAPAPVVKPSSAPVGYFAKDLDNKELLREARSVRKGGRDPEKYERIMEELRRRGRAGDKACLRAYEKLEERDGSFAVEVPPVPISEVKPAPAPVVKPAPAPGYSVPAPEVKPAPVPVVKPSPAPVVKPSPAPVVKPSPAPVVKPSPAPVVKPSPAPVDGGSVSEEWTPQQKDLYNELKGWSEKYLKDKDKVGKWQKELGLTPEKVKAVVEYIRREQEKSKQTSASS